jgi:hypothetical protein
MNKDEEKAFLNKLMDEVMENLEIEKDPKLAIEMPDYLEQREKVKLIMSCIVNIIGSPLKSATVCEVFKEIYFLTQKMHDKYKSL